MDEFIKLKDRYLQAIEYWNSKYSQDSQEGQKWAEAQVIEIRKSIEKIWDKIPEDEKQKFLEDILRKMKGG